MGIGESTCDVCGENLPEGAYFCGECGASVPEFGAPVDTSARRVDSPQSGTQVEPSVPPVAEPRTLSPDALPRPAEAAAETAPYVPPVAPPVAQPIVQSPTPEAVPVASPPVSPPSLPAESAAAVVTPFTLVFSTGERAQVVGRGLIGRMPVAPADEVCDHLIVVNDVTKTVSKTHLRVEALAQGLMVTDLDSANGTVVSLPGIAAERLAPHERVILMSGATVGIGDQSFTIQ